MQKRLFPRIAAAASALLLLAACGQSRPEGPAEVLLHTTAGDIRIELDGRTPLHRDNFLKLTREGFFDSVLFHRVIPDSLRTIYETTGGTPFLDGQYTVFGRVTEGLEIVEAIQGVATDSVGRPLEDVRIIRAEAVRK